MQISELPIYIFDGSFYGLLCSIFESYERKHSNVKLLNDTHIALDLFETHIKIHTDTEKALRVWNGLKNKISANHQKHFYSAFLADDIVIHQLMFNYAHYIFDHSKGHDANYGNEWVLSLQQISNKVHREKHRMKAFIRFSKANNGMFYTIINPDYNVIPLLIKHFKSRYTDQTWLIYDEKRKYGIYYDLYNVHEVTMDFLNEQSTMPITTIVLDEQESLYATLWKDYFKSTNIKERKNLKLHIQHVPKRYWRYLTEKME